MKTRIILLVSALLFTLFFAVSCTQGEPPKPADSTANAAITDFVIIRPDTASEGELASANALCDSIKTATGSMLAVESDFILRGETMPEDAYEILVGSTNRPASAKIRITLGDKDYSITVSGKRIVIAGGSDEALANAVTYFTTNYIVDGKLSPVGDGYTYTDPASVPAYLQSLTIAGAALSDYVIVVADNAPSSETNTAQKLQNYFANKLAVDVAIKKESEGEAEREILVGATSRAATSAVTEGKGAGDTFAVISGTKYIVAGGDTAGLTQAYEYFIDLLAGEAGGFDLTEEYNVSGLFYENPLREEPSGDPFITYDNDTGYYYAIYSAPNNDRVTLYRAKKLDDLRDDPGKEIYVASKQNEITTRLYAPEIHKVDGKWYIYASGATVATDDGTTASKSIRLFCLEALTDDPYGEYQFKALLNKDIRAIDAHVFYLAATGKYYVCYAEIVPGSGNVVSIAELENAWTLNPSKRARIGFASLAFEKRSGSVNEGPMTFEHDGKLFMLYSANNVTSAFYCMGLLECTNLENPVSKASWKKSEAAVFESGNGVFYPGHCSVFKSPDGSEYYVAYHARLVENDAEGNIKGERWLFVQPFTFDENNNPVFGEPIAPNTKITSPAGE